MLKITGLPEGWDCGQVTEGLSQTGRVSCGPEDTACAHLSVRLRVKSQVWYESSLTLNRSCDALDVVSSSMNLTDTTWQDRLKSTQLNYLRIYLASS